MHVAVDDNSWVIYAEQLPDERKRMVRAFTERALAFYKGLGAAVEHVMTDSGPAYRSGEFNAPLKALGISRKYTRSSSPRLNGKVERTNRTLAQEQQCTRAWESREARASALASFVSAPIGTVRKARAGACPRCHA